MSKVTVFGCSDDLVEIEGDIREEVCSSEMTYLGFSDGTVLSAEYAEGGCWRIMRPVVGSAKMTKVSADGPDAENYSDRVTLEGDIRWVVAGAQMSKVKSPNNKLSGGGAAK